MTLSAAPRTLACEWLQPSPLDDGAGDDVAPEVVPAGPLVAGRKPRARRWTRAWVLRRGVELLVLGGAAVFLLRRVGHLGQVAGAFDHLHWHWLILAIAAEAGSVASLSWLQQKLLRVGALPVGVKDLVPVTLASNAVSLSLPAGTLFAEGYTFRQYQWLGATPTLAIWSQLSAGALATAALAAVAVAGAAFAPGLRLELLPVLTVVLAGAVVAAALFRRAPLLGSLIGKLLRGAERILPASVCRHLRSAQNALRQMDDFNPPTRLWLACFGAAAVNWLLDSVVLIMGLLTVGAPVPWKGLLISYAAAQVLVELPITPGGLGLVEGGLVEVLIRFHDPASLATAGTLVYRAVSYWLLLLVGWSAALYLTLRNRRATRAATTAATRPI
jgi:putative heme transporter